MANKAVDSLGLPPDQARERVIEFNSDKVLEIAADAGHILLENGAEILRVEETIKRISAHFGVDAREVYVLTNGIFITGQGHRIGEKYARIEHIPVHGSRLDKVIAVNQLSREIERGLYTLDQIPEKLEEIRNMPFKRPVAQVVACALGCGSFAVIFGGSLMDGLCACIAGIFLQIFMMYLGEKHMSKMTRNLFGGAIVTLICILCYTAGLSDGLSHMIIGGIIALVPGIAFTNGIRDIGNGDYLSGAIRMLDALLVFMCIAIGVGSVFLIYNQMFGGVLL